MKKSVRNIFLLIINIAVAVFLIVNFMSFQNNRYSQSWANEGYFAASGYYDDNRGGYFIDESSNYQGVFTCGPYTHLDKGIYNVTVYFETDTDSNVCYAYDDDLQFYHNGLQSDTVVLPKGATSVNFKIWVNHDAEFFEVRTDYCGMGSLLIKEIVVEKSIQSYTYGTSIAVFVLVLFDLFICYFAGKMRSLDKMGRLVVCVLTGTVLLTAAPVFMNGFEIPICDGEFHMLRIDGIADSIRTGNIPVKIQPNWINDYGYAVSVYYGDLFLYFPAFLRLLGFTLELAYKVFIFAMALLTVIISYFSFKGIFKSRAIGLVCGMFYSLSTCALFQLHYANALGQYIATAFWPMLFYGLYAILKRTDFKEKSFQLMLPIIVAVTVIVNSHLPSVKVTALFLGIFLACYYRELLNKERLVLFLKTVIIVILLNAGFLIPFFDFYVNEEVIATNAEMYMHPGMYIQRWGSAIFQNLTVQYKNAPTNALQMAMLLVFCALLFCFQKEIRKNDDGREWVRLGKICTIVAFISLFMSSEIFPGDLISDLLAKKAHIYNEMMFPARWGFISLLFCTVVVGVIIKLLQEIVTENNLRMGTIVFIIILVINALGFYNVIYRENVDNDERLHFYDTAVLPTDNLYGGQYLPVGTDWNQYEHNKIVKSEGLEISGYSKSGLQICFTCENYGAERYIELPLTYYTGYEAIDIDTGQVLRVEKGNNNVVKIIIPQEYMGLCFGSV